MKHRPFLSMYLVIILFHNFKGLQIPYLTIDSGVISMPSSYAMCHNFGDKSISIKVNFTVTFENDPIVLINTKSFDLGGQAAVMITNVGSITKKDFVLTWRTWYKWAVCSSQMTWIAYDYKVKNLTLPELILLNSSLQLQINTLNETIQIQLSKINVLIQNKITQVNNKIFQLKNELQKQQSIIIELSRYNLTMSNSLQIILSRFATESNRIISISNEGAEVGLSIGALVLSALAFFMECYRLCRK